MAIEISISFGTAAGLFVAYLIAESIVRCLIKTSPSQRLVIGMAIAGTAIISPVAAILAFLFGGNIGGSLGAGLSEWLFQSSIGAAFGIGAGVAIVLMVVLPIGALIGASVGYAISRVVHQRPAA